MYFDVVISSLGVVLFNGSPDETKTYLRKNSENLKKDTYVVPGSTLKPMSMREYLLQ